MAASLLSPLDSSPLSGLYELPLSVAKHLQFFKMPRVVPDQKSKFEADELFRRLAREGEVRYTAYRDRPPEERRQRFQAGIREGQAEIAFTCNGINLTLCFPTSGSGFSNQRDVDFDKEPGKVYIRSPFILNGVCVRWRGWLDLDRLDGLGCLEYDEENAVIENRTFQDDIEKYRQRVREFEEKQRAFRYGGVGAHGHHHQSGAHHFGSPHHGHGHHGPAHTPEQANIQVR